MSPIFRTPEAKQQVLARYRDVLRAWPVARTERMLSTREGETFVVSCGAASSPPLILLHGAHANAASWMMDAAYWSRRFRVHAIDMIGEPGLSAPSRPPFDSETHAFWLDDVLDGLGIKCASFVGISLGGWLGLDYAIRRGDRVAKLVLICPAGIGRQKNFLLKAAPLMLLGPWGIATMRKMVLGPMPDDLAPEAEAVIELMNLIGRECRVRPLKPPRFNDEALATLRMPLLAIVGGQDVLLDSRDTQRRLQQFVPQAQIRFLPEARHLIRGQAPTILAFLMDSDARSHEQ
jgi:pimeloyl-ACP methyl ester carboxylesterase